MISKQQGRKTLKKVEIDKLIFILNEEENDASIFHIIHDNDNVFIPFFIKYENREYIVNSLMKNSFQNSDIKSIIFANDSKIMEIEENSFSNSKIKSISIPKNVLKIGSNAFYTCMKLRLVEIPTDSKLQIIENYAFSESLIESIFIPQNVTKIGEYAFSSCQMLQTIEISKNSKLLIIEKFAFYKSSISKISMPSNVREICESKKC